MIVALWFAALLGIGSLILPIVLIEKLVVATGLPTVLSAAQPPLGFTARAGIALAATVGGAVIGLVVALQVARSHRTAVANRSTNPSDLIRRPPVNAHAELGSEGFDGNGTSRRRALALAAADEEETEDHREAAYAPSQPQHFELEETFAVEEAVSEAEDAPASMPFAPPVAEFEPNDSFDEDALDAQDAYETDAATIGEPTPAPFAKPAPFARPFEAEDAEPMSETQEPEWEPEAEEEPQAFAPPPAADRPAPGAVREDLAELGLVQLVQKLEATIEKHRAWLIEKNQRAAEAAVATADDLPEPTPLDTEEAFGTIAPDEAAQARQAYFDAPAPAPVSADEGEDNSHPAPVAALADFAPEHDNEDEDDQEAAALSASFALPFAKQEPNRTVLRQVFQSDPAPETEDLEEAPQADHDSFASLNRDLAQRRLRAVRIEEPETEGGEEAAVVFPGQSARASDRSFDPPKAVSSPPVQPQDAKPAASSEETDQALREALRNLQRMGRAS
ncbi:MAG: hypothetical protein B7Y88_11750 [Sphingomonadales bacterium 32-64-17]|nr:MAG: hypothetical protein B7Y88_11750 [Sphingomonadales bacterium 32-64-17]